MKGLQIVDCMVPRSSFGSCFSVAQRRNMGTLLERRRRLIEVAGEELGSGLVDWDVPRMGFEMKELVVLAVLVEQKPHTFD